MSLFGSLLKLVAIGAFFVATGPFGLAVGKTLATVLRIGGMVLGYLGAAIDRPKTSQERQTYAMTGDPGAPLPVVYGRAKVGSIVADWFIDAEDEGNILYMPVALCHGSRDGSGIAAIEELWLDNRRAVVNPTSGELAESGGNDVREHPFALSALDYKIFLGTATQNVGSTDLSGLFPDADTKSPSDVTDSGWSATTDTGKGIAVVSLRLCNLVAGVFPASNPDKRRQPIFSGPPNVSAIVFGNFVEDPRSAINVTGQPINPAQVTFANVGAADTITVQNLAGDDLTDWKAGDRIAVTGSASNNGIYTIASVAGLVITVSASDALTNEGPTTAAVLKRWASPATGGDNPALCIRDYLLSTVYGCGQGATLIHEASFRDCADYCDVLIDYPLTAAVEQSVRFTCNGVLDTGRSTKSNLDELLSSCRGALVWEQGQWKLSIRGMLNLIDNPDFETDVVGMTAIVATVVRSTAQYHAGVASCLVTTTNAANSGIRVERRAKPTEPYEDGFPVVVGRPYTWSAWVYAPAGSVGKVLRIVIGWSDGIGGVVLPAAEANTTLVLGWQLMTVTGTANPASVTAEPYLLTTTAQGVFDFYVDEVSFGPDPVVALTPANIIGPWSFRNAGSEERWNLAKATFVDPLNGEYKATETQWPSIGANAYLTADNEFLNRLDIALPFTNDQPMAQAIAQVMLNEARNGIACQVVCTEEALVASVGDRVTVTHPTPGWTAKEFWVVGMELRPDTTVGLSLMEYEPAAYDLATMNDRRTYPATDHATPDESPAVTTVGFGMFSLRSTTLWLQADGYAYPNGACGICLALGYAHLSEAELPSGREIYALQTRYYVTGDPGNNVESTLYRVPDDGSAPEVLVTTGTLTDTSAAWVTDEAPLIHTVDWNTNHYYVRTSLLVVTGTLTNTRFQWNRLLWR